MPKDQQVRLPVVKSETVFAGKIWDVIRESFNFGSDTLTREFVQHPGAVAILAVNDHDDLLLIRQYRHPVKSYLWEIPAGLLDVPGERLEDAAARELLEETGYRAGRLEPLISFYTTPGGNSEQISVFLARELTLIGYNEQLEGEERELEVRWVPAAEALSAVLSSEIGSPSAVVGILAHALQGQRSA